MRALFFSLILSLPTFVRGDDARPVNCRFLCFGLADSPGSVITLTEKGAEIPCALPVGEISKKVICYSKDGTIPFFSAADKTPAATATVPAGMNAALLVFVPIPKKADESAKPSAAWHVFVIEDSPGNFPDGGAFIANFFNNDIRFIIGEHKGMLHAAGFHGYAMPTERNAFNMAPVIFELFQDEKWNVASESAMRFLPGIRYLIFAYADPLSGRPRISIIHDITLPTVPQKPAH